MGQHLSLQLCGSRQHYDEECTIQPLDSMFDHSVHRQLDDFTLIKRPYESCESQVLYYQDSDDEEECGKPSLPSISSSSSIQSSAKHASDPYCSTDEESSPTTSPPINDQSTRSAYTVNHLTHSRSFTTFTQSNHQNYGYYTQYQAQTQPQTSYLSPNDSLPITSTRTFRTHRRPPPFEPLHPSTFQPSGVALHNRTTKQTTPTKHQRQEDDSPECQPSRSIFQSPRRSLIDDSDDLTIQTVHPGTALALLRELKSR